MREGDDDEEEEHQDEPQPVHERFDQDGGEAGAFVQQARAMLDDGEQPAQQEEQENKGPGIKMKRGIGGRRKKPAAGAGGSAAAEDPYKREVGGAPNAGKVPIASGIGAGGFTEQDIEFMKKAIQILCQSTNPLGKSIDFVTDDVDSMAKEYEFHRKEAANCQ
jgi:hypothetical protein